MRIDTTIDGIKVEGRAVSGAELSALAETALGDGETLTATIPVYQTEGLRHYIRLNEDGAAAVAETLAGCPINTDHAGPIEFPRQGGVRAAWAEGSTIWADVEIDGEHTLGAMAKGDRPRASIEFTYPRHAATCSIEGNRWFEVVDNGCRHKPGLLYDGEQCFIDVGAGAEGAGLAVLFGQAAPNTGFMTEGESDPLDAYTARQQDEGTMDETTTTTEAAPVAETASAVDDLALLRAEFDARFAAVEARAEAAEAALDTERVARFSTENHSTVIGWMREGRPIRNGSRALEHRATMAALGALEAFDAFVADCLTASPSMAPGQRTTADLEHHDGAVDNSPAGLKVAADARMAADGTDYTTALQAVMTERGIV